MDKGTKIIIAIAIISLILMLSSLGHDLFSTKNISADRAQSVVLQLK